MKLVVQVKLLPEAATASALRETLTLCNQAANQVSRAAFTTGTTGKQELQRLTYTAVKQLGVSAQPALQCIHKTRRGLHDAASEPGGRETTALRGRNAANVLQPNRSGSARTRRNRSTIAACPGSSTPAPYPSGPSTAGPGTFHLPALLSKQKCSPTTVAANQISCTGADTGTCTRPARSLDRSSPTRAAGSSGWIWASPTSPPPVTALATPETPQLGPAPQPAHPPTPATESNEISEAATAQDLRPREAVRRRHQPPCFQDDRDRGSTHLTRYRPRRSGRYPREGTATQAPAGHAALLEFRATGHLHRLQSPPRQDPGGACGPAVHLPTVLGVRAHLAEEPARPGHLCLHVMRFR